MTEVLLNLPPHCSLANIPLTPETARDQERRIRREIANSNERRRMQSINAGFQSLKTLIPHSDGEKLSKVTGPGRRAAPRWEISASPHVLFPCVAQAAILQQTAEYIFTLEQEKTRLLQQNSQLKRILQVNHRQTQQKLVRCPPGSDCRICVACLAGAERLVAQEEAGRREGRRHRLPGHPGGGEDRRPEEGDD